MYVLEKDYYYVVIIAHQLIIQSVWILLFFINPKISGCVLIVFKICFLVFIVWIFHIGNGKECNELHCKESVSSNSQDIEYSTFDNKNERSERVHIKYFYSWIVIKNRGENGNKKGHIFTSGFRGVYSRGDKWNAQIQYNGKKVVWNKNHYNNGSIWEVIHLKKKLLMHMILLQNVIMVIKQF